MIPVQIFLTQRDSKNLVRKQKPTAFTDRNGWAENDLVCVEDDFEYPTIRGFGGALTEGRQKLEAVLGLLTYKLDVLLRDPSASTVSVNDALDLWFVIAALMLFFLSFVVQYAVRQHAPVSELPAER